VGGGSRMGAPEAGRDAQRGPLPCAQWQWVARQGSVPSLGDQSLHALATAAAQASPKVTHRLPELDGRKPSRPSYLLHHIQTP
jgi:hypothetical protein